MSTPTTPILDVEGLRTASDSIEALGAVLADDVEWIEIDQRSRPQAPAVHRGREAVLAMVREGHERGIDSRVTDGFAAGDRAALTVTCTYPSGGRVICNALADVRDGKITRWYSVQAWDD
jgi:ketosteroid isomerase-like protein